MPLGVFNLSIKNRLFIWVFELVFGAVEAGNQSSQCMYSFMVCKVSFYTWPQGTSEVCWEDEYEEFTQLVMSQNTADATTVQRKQGINEAGREILCRQANCRIFCVWPLTNAWPPGRTVAVMHSIPNRSDWLCVKFPVLCHSNMSCVLGCHSTLFMKDDLLGQRSQTDCPQDLLAPDGFCCICIRLKFLNWLLMFKKLEEICIPGFLEKIGESDNTDSATALFPWVMCSPRCHRPHPACFALLHHLRGSGCTWVWEPWPKSLSYVTCHVEQGLANSGLWATSGP